MNRRSFIKSMLLAGGSYVFAGTAYAYQSMALEITHDNLRIEGLTKKLRVVALSDLHAPCFYLSDDSLVNTINNMRPDVFILGGDIVDRSGNENLVSLFKNVKAGAAKLAIFGNWEYHGRLDKKALMRAYRRAGVNVLVNDIFRLPELTIVGLDDYLYGKPDYSLVGQASNKNRPILVLAHCPASFDRFRSGGSAPFITIAGHTHGGQIAPFGKALITPPGSGDYVHGWYHRRHGSMYVMRGVGATVIPVRMGANPEIFVLDLEPAGI